MLATRLLNSMPGHPPPHVPTVADRARRFDDLFTQLYTPLFGLAYRLVGDRAEAEDLLQETFLRLADAPILAQRDEEVAAWLRRVCLNLGTNRLRDQRRAQQRLERAGRLEISDERAHAIDDASPSQSVLRQEEQGAVRRALAQLPERQRSCLLLRHAGYSYAEIAATLDLAIGSVGVLLARAERAFRVAYLEQNPDGSSLPIHSNGRADGQDTPPPGTGGLQ